MMQPNEIPRIIHWCWLSGEPVPPFIAECMATWKRHFPGYTFKCWTQEAFDIHSVRWVEEAVARRKWAFAADYIRLYALYTEGGIYLDSDVEVFKPFDKLLRYDFFSAAEYYAPYYKNADPPVDAEGIPYDRDAFVTAYGIQAAVMGAKKGNAYVRECMAYYENRAFCEPDGTLRTDLIMPLVMAKIAERHGFRYVNKPQVLGQGLYIGNQSLLPSCIHLLRQGTLALHHCAGSWLDTKKSEADRLIGHLRLWFALKYAAKMQWWRLRRWRKAHLAKLRTKKQRNTDHETQYSDHGGSRIHRLARRAALRRKVSRLPDHKSRQSDLRR